MNVILIQLAMILDLVKDRKDRSTKAYFDHETALVSDIKVAGVRNPIKVIALADHFYQIVCGQTRLNASRRVGLASIPAIVLEGSMTPTRLLTEELADNNMTEGFDILAQGGIYLDLMKENGWTQAELCANVPAAKPGPVSKALSVFENLADELKQRLRMGEFGPRLGYALSRLPGEAQVATFEKVKHMKVEAAEAYISGLTGGKKPKQPKPEEVKVSLPGFTATFTVFDIAKVRAYFSLLEAALTKIEKHQLTFNSLPQLVKAQ